MSHLGDSGKKVRHITMIAGGTIPIPSMTLHLSHTGEISSWQANPVTYPFFWFSQTSTGARMNRIVRRSGEQEGRHTQKKGKNAKKHRKKKKTRTGECELLRPRGNRIKPKIDRLTGDMYRKTTPEIYT